MSRNKEKAQSALNRYQAQVSREAGVLESDPSQRPKYVQSVESLPQAEKWRQTVVTEISVNLTKINDPTLPESEIRLLNDTLNRLHREKRAWEHHIKQLGGNDYISFGSQVQGLNIKGTRYYGRARELAEVKQTREVKEHKEKPSEKPLGLEYYGVFDGDGDGDREGDGDGEGDGDWEGYGDGKGNANGILLPPIDYNKLTIMAEINTALGEKVLPAPYIPKQATDTLPTNEDVERWLVEKRRAELLAQLAL